MVKIVIDQNEYQQAWEANNLDLLQSWQWGEIKKPEFEPIRLLINNSPITFFIKKVKPFGLKYGYSPRIFKNAAINPNDLRELIAYCKNNLKLSHILIDPNVTNPEFSEIFTEVGFKQNGTTTQPNQTNMIDLTKTEEQLWLDLRPSSRRNINKAVKKGCKAQTFSNGDEAIERFYKVNTQVNAEARIKYTAYGFNYYKKVWDILSKDNMARIYIISLDNQDIGAYFVTFTKTKLNELYGGVNKFGKSVKAGHFIKWHSILEAKKLGLVDYDQWGVAPLLKNQDNPLAQSAAATSTRELAIEQIQTDSNPQPANELLTKDFDPNDKLAYISEFKFSFGGNYVEFLPQQLYVFSKPAYLLYKIMKRIKS
jgi:lipid II:glycine glycyltransferase (peptidoglycan interpeptide bridge formation enzyme)